ncbi:glucose-1-phosphate cytidylyltransferase [Aquirufa nivalisilvae]|uniref:glucose-1-phosphate cytidylyltransferase n=1 Tax=Aquirufa nivalisilvae TaxID=2516557 RepID=UPI0022A9C2B3|nr:glucose-1-phosphate cytidylyltransferase [Aquirufa nivalisilvae]MCZ2481759.1 glucose-1-phosphate cytidylyltransferase [Aquirufa nivalisilvae]
MKVVILCGGQGTRIRDVADNIPKPMIPVGNYPIVWHIMKYYSLFGHKEFIICLGHQGKVIKEYFLNYQVNTSDFTLRLGDKESIQFKNKIQESDWEITFAETGDKAMTGSRIRKIKQYIGDDSQFLLTYGDGLSDVDIDKLIAYHQSHDRILTLTGVRPAGRFGEIMCTDEGVVSEFNEKPQAAEGRINGGFFVCNKELFDYLSDNDDLVFEKEPMMNLVKDQQLMQFNHDGFWQPMDTYREFILLNGLYENNNAPWKKW